MQDRKTQAIIKSTRKLLSSNTPEDDIIISLKEIGLDEEQSKNTLEMAKQSNDNSGKTPADLKGAKTVNKISNLQSDTKPKVVSEKEKTQETMKKNAIVKAGTEKAAEVPQKKIVQQSIAEETKQDGLSFFTRFLKKNKPEEKIRPKEKTFIPKLKKGGKEKVREILSDSPLDAKEDLSHDSIKKDLLQKPREQPAKKAPEKGRIAESTLDLLERNIEKGKKISEAMDSIIIDKTPVTKSQQSKAIVQPKVTVLIIPNKQYSEGMATLAKAVDLQAKKIIYVNLNELYSSLIKNLQNMGVDVRKFFFVDAVTLTSDKNTEKHDNCIFVSSPNSLIELSLGITQALNTQKPDVLVFDSLSTLLVYEKDVTVTKFVHSLIGKIKANNIDAYFTALEGDSQNDSIKDIGMFVDKFNTLTEFELGQLGFDKQQTAMGLGLKGAERLGSQAKAGVHGTQNEMILDEMESLRDRLQDLHEDQKVAKHVSKLAGKMEKMSELDSIQQKMDDLSKKFDQKKDDSLNKTLLEQINRLEKKFDDFQSKGNKKGNDSVGEMKEIMDLLKTKIDKIEKFSDIEEQIKEISEKINLKRQDNVDSALVNQLTRLEKKIGLLESKISEKGKEKKLAKEKKTIKEKFESFKKQMELERMMDDTYGLDVSKVNPEVIVPELEKRLDKKNKVLEKAYSEGVISGKYYSLGKKRINHESKRLKHAAEIHALEEKLIALNEGYASGVIGKESYLKGKSRIEKLLKK